MTIRDEEAADWCVRLAEGSLDDSTGEAFDRWHVDPQNRAALEDAIAAWQGIEQVADWPEVIHTRTKALESFRLANSRRWSSRRTRRWGWLAAAAVLIAAIVGVQFFRASLPQRYETSVAERRVVVLSDGTQVSLDAATVVEARLDDSRRALKLLSGRAKFTVARDVLRPFTVTAANQMVVALGTAFSVELLQRQMRVVLYEGRVEVRADNGRGVQLITPGEELAASAGRDNPIVAKADLHRTLSWESGQLNFQDEPLALAVERMNRYARQSMVVEEGAAGNLVINGVFNAGDTQAFIEGLQSLLPVRVETEDGKLVIRSAVPSVR